LKDAGIKPWFIEYALERHSLKGFIQYLANHGALIE